MLRKAGIDLPYAMNQDVILLHFLHHLRTQSFWPVCHTIDMWVQQVLSLPQKTDKNKHPCLWIHCYCTWVASCKRRDAGTKVFSGIFPMTSRLHQDPLTHCTYWYTSGFLNENISWVREFQKQMHKALEGFYTQHGVTEWSCPAKHRKSTLIKSQKPTFWIFLFILT